jgi:hypothetical protein
MARFAVGAPLNPLPASVEFFQNPPVKHPQAVRSSQSIELTGAVSVMRRRERPNLLASIPVAPKSATDCLVGCCITSASARSIRLQRRVKTDCSDSAATVAFCQEKSGARRSRA